MASSSQASTHQNVRKGKQKVKMAKMENKNNLQVTFSKRRSGLFKKTSELCTMTGSKIGVIVFSPGRKVFSFGHPSIHEIINDCFPEASEVGGTRNGVVSLPRCDKRLVEAHRSASVAEESMRVSTVEKQMEVARRWTAAIEERERAEMEGHVGIEGMMEGELVEMGACLDALKESIMMRMERDRVVPNQATSLHSDLGAMDNPGLGSMCDLGL